MSSWLISLHGTAGNTFRPRRSLERYGFAMSCIPDDLLDAAPGRLGAEAAAEIIQQCSNLIVRHAIGKTRHDGAAFPAYGANARENDIGGITRVRRAEGRAEAKVDSAVGQRPPGLMTVCAGSLIDQCTGIISCGRLSGDRLTLRRFDIRTRGLGSIEVILRRRPEYASHVKSDRAHVILRYRREILGHFRHRPAGDAVIGIPALTQIVKQRVSGPGQRRTRLRINGVSVPVVDVATGK